MPYSLKGSLGTVYFNPSETKNGTIKKESKTISGSVTSYPVESDYSAADHFERAPTTGSLSGVLIGGIESAYLLNQMAEKGDILTYTGSFRTDNIIITKFDYSTDSTIEDGFNFTVNYQQVNIVSAQYIEMGQELLMSQQDAGKSEAVKTNAAPSQGGLQTTSTQTVSTQAYMDYIESFNGKPTPNQGPSMRTTPVNTGY